VRRDKKSCRTCLGALGGVLPNEQQGRRPFAPLPDEAVDRGGGLFEKTRRILRAVEQQGLVEKGKKAGATQGRADLLCRDRAGVGEDAQPHSYVAKSCQGGGDIRIGDQFLDPVATGGHPDRRERVADIEEGKGVGQSRHLDLPCVIQD
jgi:hypothetical protein